MEINFSKFQNERTLIMEHSDLIHLAERSKERIFHEYITLLVRNNVVSCDGIVDKTRNGCYCYINDVIPFLIVDDFMQLLTDSSTFGKRFVFSAGFSKRESSLAYWLQKNGFLSEAMFESLVQTFDKDVVFDDFRKQTGLSPYERVLVHEIEEFIEPYLGDYQFGFGAGEDEY